MDEDPNSDYAQLHRRRDDVTSGELARRLDRNDRANRENFTRLFVRLEEHIKDHVTPREFGQIVKELEDLIARRRWTFSQATAVGCSVLGSITAIVLAYAH